MRKSQPIFSDINITPLTDIFLVLLIIMMVIAPLLDNQGLKLSVPTVGPAADTKEQPKAITVVVDAAGQYQIAGAPVGVAELATTLSQKKAANPDGIIIQADPEARHEAVVKVIDAAESQGIDKIALTNQSVAK